MRTYRGLVFALLELDPLADVMVHPVHAASPCSARRSNQAQAPFQSATGGPPPSETAKFRKVRRAREIPSINKVCSIDPLDQSPTRIRPANRKLPIHQQRTISVGL